MSAIDDTITVTPFNQSIITDGDVQITAAGSGDAIDESLRAALAHGEEADTPDQDDTTPPAGETLPPAGDEKTPEQIAADEAAAVAATAAAANPVPPTPPPAPSRGILDLQRRLADTTKAREDQRKRADVAEAERIRVASENIRIRDAAIAAGVTIPGLTDKPAPVIPGAQPAAVDPIAALGPAPKFEDFTDHADPYAAFNTASADYNRKYADAAVAKDRMVREADQKKADEEASAIAAGARYQEEVVAFVDRRTKFHETNPEAKAIADAYFAAEQAAAEEWAQTHDVAVEPYQGEYLSRLVQDYLRIEEGGPMLAVHFMQHPEDLRRIQTLPKDPAIAALGRLEGQLLRDGWKPVASTAETPTPAAAAAAKLRSSATSKPGAGSKPSTTPGVAAPRTSAHTPPPVAGGSPSATGKQALEDADADTYIRERNKQEGRPGRRAR